MVFHEFIYVLIVLRILKDPERENLDLIFI